jgi:hypothetical protein
MTLLKEYISAILNEQKGAQWTVYHSFGDSFESHRNDIVHTSSEPDEVENAVKERISSILEDGFTPGAGAAFGKGIYTVLEFGNASHAYGPFTLRFRVSLNGFLIFDAAVARTVYGKYAGIEDQLKLLGFHSRTPKVRKLISRIASASKYNKSLTSEMALEFSRQVGMQDMLAKSMIKGYVFDGLGDGLVCVGFNPDDFTLTGWTMEDRVQTSDFVDFISEQAGYDFISKIAAKHSVNPKVLYRFTTRLVMNAKEEVLQSNNIEKDFPHAHRMIKSVVYSELADEKDEYVRNKFPEDLLKYNNEFTSDEFMDRWFDGDMPEEERAIAQKAMDNVEGANNEFDRLTAQKLIAIIEQTDFNDLPLSRDKRITTDFNTDLDGTPLRNWWKTT